MPKSKEVISTSESESGSDEPKPKKKKKESKEAKEEVKDDKFKKIDGNIMFELGGNKYATVSQFKGKTYVGVREYYEKDGKTLPTKKGCALNMDQWAKFKAHVDDLDTALTKF